MRARGVRALYLFGSTAAGVARDDSDVDIFIEPEWVDRFNAFDLGSGLIDQSQKATAAAMQIADK